MPYFFSLSAADGRVTGVYDAYRWLRWRRRWHAPGYMEMEIPAHHAQGIEPGVIIGPLRSHETQDPDALYMVERIELELGRGGHASEIVRVSGRSLGGMLAERLCVPPTGQAYHSLSGPAESVMKQFVSANAVSPADTNRGLPNWAVAQDLGRGPTVSYAARYHVLADVLADISLDTGLGWDVQRGPGNAFTFDVLLGRHRWVGNPYGEPAVVISPMVGTAEAQRWLRDQMGVKTVAYVLGQGEGAARVIETVSLSDSPPTGYARREMAIDARDLDSVDALRLRGRARLREHGGEESLEVEIDPRTSLGYRDMWDLGDIVTVHNAEWGVQTNLRVVEVEVSWDPGRGYAGIRVALGRPVNWVPAHLRNLMGDIVSVSRGV